MEVVEVAMNELRHSRYCGALLARRLYAESAKLCVLISGRRYSTVSREMDVSTVSLGAQTILTPVIVAEVPPDGASSQIGLRLHQACSRMSKLGGHAHDRRRIVTGTVPDIGYDRGRANQDEGGDHCKLQSSR